MFPLPSLVVFLGQEGREGEVSQVGLPSLLFGFLSLPGQGRGDRGGRNERDKNILPGWILSLDGCAVFVLGRCLIFSLFLPFWRPVLGILECMFSKVENVYI